MSNVDRLYSGCRTRAIDTVSGRGFAALGPVLRRSLVADQILILLDQQDREGVSDAVVRQLIADLRERLTDDETLQ